MIRSFQKLKQNRTIKLSLTKQKIIEKISKNIILSSLEAKDTIEDRLEIMKSTLVSGEDILITGFGKFKINEKAPVRKGTPLQEKL
jgi:integration host factor subunit alpha